MRENAPRRAHLIAGGFPPGQSAGHDHDYARLRLLQLFAEREIAASVGNDFADLEKWLPVTRLLVTYVAGPYPEPAQCRALARWLEAGGHWLALHGTSGGRAERVEGLRQRRSIPSEHHRLLGCRFLTHPPIAEIRVAVREPEHPLTRGLGHSFEVEDEPYFVELQEPEACRILLTADYGASGEWPVVETLYGRDTSLLPDGRSRVIAHEREVGAGRVAYVALGHCHNPAVRTARADPADRTSATFRGAWARAPFIRLLQNAIDWGVGG